MGVDSLLEERYNIMEKHDLQNTKLEINKICSSFGVEAEILTAPGEIIVELFGEFPGWEIVGNLSTEITNKFKEINRVVWRTA